MADQVHRDLNDTQSDSYLGWYAVAVIVAIFTLFLGAAYLGHREGWRSQTPVISTDQPFRASVRWN